MSELPPILEEPPAPNPFAKFAVVYSITAPLISVCLYAFVSFLMSDGHTKMTTSVMISLCAVVVIILGFAFGIVGFAIIKRRQNKGLVALALIGICLNGLFLSALLIVPFLLPLMVGHKYPATAQGRLQSATEKLAEATNNEDRFYVLDDAAKESVNVGNIDNAGNFAKELLAMAPDFKSNWNYGNAIQDGNLVLGRIALREGHIQEAGQYLLAAGKSPGSPQMDSFGPNMSLAKDLLEKGQREVVLQYFGLCRKFWTMDYGKLDEWSNEVKAGKIPDFGANLVY
ncbi:MAG TPA: hypothetical protein VNX46_10020 [Candidatus Acidoferrum sp.]|jgi:hypothetical protein|nr:hypothetical protein [Candidatus Acidoferrum sp.]